MDERVKTSVYPLRVRALSFKDFPRREREGSAHMVFTMSEFTNLTLVASLTDAWTAPSPEGSAKKETT